VGVSQKPKPALIKKAVWANPMKNNVNEENF